MIKDLNQGRQEGPGYTTLALRGSGWVSTLRSQETKMKTLLLSYAVDMSAVWIHLT